MSEQYKDAHDPAISAVYRKTGDLAPPTSLDEAILATAKQAVRQRRQRWMLPMSTAAVLMMSVTVLLNMNEEWRPSGESAGSAPASHPKPRMADKRKPALPAASSEPAVEEAPYRAEAEVSAQIAAPAAQAPGEAKTQQAAIPRGLATDTARLSKSASAPSAELAESTARSKAESAGVLAFSNGYSSMADSVEREKNKKETAAAEVLEPKPWLEKIRKLLEAGKKADAKRELESFKKRYPAYTLPDVLKSL